MIDGLTLTPRRQIPDERGAVWHMLRASDPAFAGFGEVYFSTVKPGAVKAWKRHRETTLNIVCIFGEIRFVFFDDRPGSTTFGEVSVVDLSPAPETYSILTVPPGLWAGFSGIAQVESMLCNCIDLPHDPAESDRLPADSPTIPYSWSA
jgi:dTDP-4-dehydrorhamnose 3,5-epimerase